jgi:lysophospholipase L1-like esterase
MILIIAACPPFAIAVEVVFLAVFSAWYIAWNLSKTRSRLRSAAALVLAVLLVVLSISEFQHRQMPTIMGPSCDHLVVIGDSISAGLDPRFGAWPTVMQQRTGIPVRNLARVGATTADGVDMASAVMANDRVILIEIGGNDPIAGLSSASFERSLEAILSRMAERERTVVMFELPLLPQHIDYGRIQRRLAAKYDVWLIPKRYFVGVMSGSEATSDGLHLRPEGTYRMADLVSHALAPVLKPLGGH